MTIFDIFNQIERGLIVLERFEKHLVDLVEKAESIVQQLNLLNKALRGK